MGRTRRLPPSSSCRECLDISIRRIASSTSSRSTTSANRSRDYKGSVGSGQPAVFHFSPLVPSCHPPTSPAHLPWCQPIPFPSPLTPPLPPPCHLPLFLLLPTHLYPLPSPSSFCCQPLPLPSPLTSAVDRRRRASRVRAEVNVWLAPPRLERASRLRSTYMLTRNSVRDSGTTGWWVLAAVM